MTRLVQVALAEDVTEAEEIQAILETAGITRSSRRRSSTIPARRRTHRRRFSSPESSLEAAQHAIEAMTDPDELVADA